VDAFQEDGWSTGVCGRMLDVLQRRGESVTAVGIDNKGPIIEGNPSLGRTVNVISSRGVNILNRLSLENTNNDLEGIEELMKYLNQETSLESGIFANYWAQNLIDVLNKTDALSEMLDDVVLETDFGSGSVARKLKMVAKLMHLNEARNVNRDVFLVHNGGHDGHSLSKANLQNNLPGINQGITAFYEEMVATDMLDAVTFVMMSEFGRTNNPNSGLGCDHAWGGNAFIWGGEIKGSTILGQYPSSFDNTYEYQIGGGRLIPSRSWESMWYGITNWFGITEEEDMKYVLPNNGNMGCDLYSDKDMYTTGNTTIPGCNDRSIGIKLSMLLNEPRYLTGLEQKRICKAAIALTSNNANVTARCVVTDQKVIVNFDYNRRALYSPEDANRRFLQTEFDNITIDAQVEFLYDNPNGTLAGTEYVENSEQFAEQMSEQITGANCPSDGSRRRRLEEGCEFVVDTVDQVTAFEADVTQAPSQVPSVSSKPSGQPSRAPLSDPSYEPSKRPSSSMSPSSRPTTRRPSPEQTTLQPSPIPSFHPSSSQPTAFPSGDLSQVPSLTSTPSADCPLVLDECLNGGLRAPSTCECLCLSPHCPDAASGQCTETICPATYHETFFDDQPEPWFKFGASCTSTKKLPSSVSAIYSSKESCCATESPLDTDVCLEIPAGGYKLEYFSKLRLFGMVCPNSRSQRSTVGDIIALSILDALCKEVTGLTCDDENQVVVTKVCGEDVDIDSSPDSRRLTGVDGDDTVEYTFISQSLTQDDLREIESLLSLHLQGATTLASFLVTVLSEILARNPPLIENPTTVYYTAGDTSIKGLGLYYPVWTRNDAKSPAEWTCISDGNQDFYMNQDHNNWLFGDLNSCCQRHFDRDIVGCMQRNAGVTRISGTISDTVNPTNGLYFPDWLRTDTCINDGTAPAYMNENSDIWMYDNQQDCCQKYYSWNFDHCMSSQSGLWYVSWEKYICEKSCEGTSLCGGTHMCIRRKTY